MTYEAEDREGYPDHSLAPLKGGRYSTILKGPEGTDVGDLHCDLEPIIMGRTPAVVTHSGWQPTDEQVAMLEAGAHVRLSVWQHPIPPLAVGVEPPVCACHEQAMMWSAHDKGFYCVVLEADPREADPLDQAHQDFTPAPDDDGPTAER